MLVALRQTGHVLLSNHLRKQLLYKMLNKINTIEIRRSFPSKFTLNKDACVAGTMAEVKEIMMQNLGLEVGFQPIPKTREHLLEYQPTAEDLPERSMEDSLTAAIIPLNTDLVLQDRYTNILGNVRMGRLMEDMDLFAVWVCHQHLCIPQLPENIHLPYAFVTILVDQLKFLEIRPKSNLEIRFSGHVTWVGNTSLEVVVWVDQMENDEPQRITRAFFLMASRNAVNTASAPINRLKTANEEEELLLKYAKERSDRRKKVQAASIFHQEPNQYEQSLIYQIFSRTSDANSMELHKRILPSTCRWMSESFTANIIQSYPEHRNAHNKVFGGFLMRCALEINFVAATIYCKVRPKLINISDISFAKPVSVSSFIKMSAYIVYTDMNYIQVMTIADVLDATDSSQMTTNVFYSTYSTPDHVPEVLPRSYQEAIWYLQGRRKFRSALNVTDAAVTD